MKFVVSEFKSRANYGDSYCNEINNVIDNSQYYFYQQFIIVAPHLNVKQIFTTPKVVSAKLISDFYNLFGYYSVLNKCKYLCYP